MEVEKFEGTDLNIDLFVKSDLRESIPKFIDMTQGIIVNTGKWLYKIKEWKVLDEIDNKAREKQDIEGFVEPYKILEELPYIYENETNFIFDTGRAVAWGMQSMRLKKAKEHIMTLTIQLWGGQYQRH